MRIRCPRCQQIVPVEGPPGEVVPCPGCGAKLRAPAKKPAAASPITPAAPPSPRKPSVVPDVEDLPMVEKVEEEELSDLPVVEKMGPEDAVSADEPVEKPRRKRPKRFDARAYTPDGGLTVLGVVLVLALEVFAGVFLGALASLIGQFFYLIVLFPLGIGAGVGGAGMLGVRVGKVRNLLVTGVIGLLGGLMAMLTMHFTDYLLFRLATQDAPPQVLRVKGADSFLGYVDYAAEQGVSIGRASSSGGGMNLGYVGTYIYWGLEVLLVAGLSFVILVGSASLPYCRQCDTWKKAQALGPLETAPDEAAEAVKEGRLHDVEPAEEETPARLKVHYCPNCREEAPVEVEVEQVTKKEKNEEQSSTLVQMTYPGEALVALGRMFPDADLGDRAEEED